MGTTPKFRKYGMKTAGEYHAERKAIRIKGILETKFSLDDLDKYFGGDKSKTDKFVSDLTHFDPRAVRTDETVRRFALEAINEFLRDEQLKREER